ncbi:MAG: hypothetical protein J3R72DRAFT_257892 [Linnemannia gamsii]|nr:MAG: hypothetical protein J3R72DRAFT_257892 [Linnemannia gamsii]
MILFGGRDELIVSYGDIYILDVPSMKWTKGKSAPATRSNMACTVAGDNFISWAGSGDRPTGTDSPTGTPLIYDLNSGQWVQKFLRSTSNKPSSSTSPSSTNGLTPQDNTEGGDASNGANGAAIGGGVAGAVVVIAAIAAIVFLVVRRRRQSRDQHNSTKDFDHVPHHDQGSSRMDDTSNGSSANLHSRWNQNRNKPYSPQFTSRNDPQSTPNSPHSTLPSYPAIPPPPNTPFQSIDRQTRVRSMDQQLIVIQEQIGAQRNNPHFIRNDPQSTPNSPESTESSPLGSSYSTLTSPSVIPPRPSKPFKSTNRQNRVRSKDQQLLAIQEQVGAHRNNPQYDPTVNGALSPSSVRGPQGIQTEPASKRSTQEIQYQLQTLQAELSRRNAM